MIRQTRKRSPKAKKSDFSVRFGVFGGGIFGCGGAALGDPRFKMSMSTSKKYEYEFVARWNCIGIIRVYSWFKTKGPRKC